jgi:hypothetical protein
MMPQYNIQFMLCFVLGYLSQHSDGLKNLGSIPGKGKSFSQLHCPRHLWDLTIIPFDRRLGQWPQG